jgi:hypothetical protein
MTKKMIQLFAITIAVESCNYISKSTTNVDEKASSQGISTTESVPSETKANLLQTFTNEDISSHKVNNGFLCSFGSVDEKNFYYVDNRDKLAIIKIDNQFLKFKTNVEEKIGDRYFS